MPSRSAARSISRSSTSVASGRPAPRNGAVGTVLVITERQRRLWMSEEDIVAFRALQCISRTLLAEDVARLALFLSSDDSLMITKQCYQVDGGLR